MALEPIVDYFSFSIPVPAVFRQYETHIKEGIPYNPDRRIKRLINFMTTSPDVIETKSSGRFNRHIQSKKLGWSYFEGVKSGVSLFQVSGTGCAHLRGTGRLDAVLHDWHDRATRLDIAVDFETMCSVEGFARSYSNRRFEFGGHESSPSGETWYIGRRTSDRHARVYRYNAPHPRSNFLRVEYELHDEQAKFGTKSVLELGVCEVAIRLGTLFGWQHEDYDLATDAEKLPSAPRPENYGNTERWIHRAVQPALEKMARNGKLQFLIDFRAWIDAIIQENDNLNV